MLLLWRGVRFNWKKFFISLAVIYTIFYVLTLPSWMRPAFQRKNVIELNLNLVHPRFLARNKSSADLLESTPEGAFVFVYKGQRLYVKEVLTAPGMPNLKERLTAPNITSTKLIYSDSDFKERNFGGCPDWKCEITDDPSKADALINGYSRDNSFDGYLLFSTQESPANFGVPPDSNYNMSIGFRHDSPVASPYGYTVLLDQKSWRSPDKLMDKALIEGKKSGAIWFVSHCTTNSKRESLVSKLEEYLDVDIFGGCSNKECPKNHECESKLNTHYHFYLALENSICKDYITEKLWHHSFLFTIVPIVLQRKLVEPYVPPNSFIAFDDYEDVEQLGKYLKHLMNNKTEYMKYFEWRQKYEVIFLDGSNHDHLERPWGLCQLCRLLHQNPLPQYRIEDVNNYWKNSCEPDGQLAKKLLS